MEALNGKMTKFQLKKMLIPLCIVALLIAMIVYTNYFILRRIGTDIVITYTNEIASHDMQKITEFVADRQTCMNGVYRELKERRFESVEELLTELNLKSYSNDFEHLCLIDSEGRLYLETQKIYESGENSFLEYFDNGERTFVARYEDKDAYYELYNECMLYGLDISDNPITVEGGEAEFVKMVMLDDIDKFSDRLKIVSFDGRGYSSVIDETGRYIVDEQVAGVDTYHNFYDLLRSGNIKDEDTEEIISQIEDGQNVSFWYSGKGIDLKFVSVYPEENLNWKLITWVERSVVTEQVNGFVRVVILIFVIVLMALIIAFIVFRVSQSRIKSLYTGIIDGVYNRQYYDEKLMNDEVKALAIIDLDRLKTINDTYGHIAGDRAIEMTARTIVNNVDKSAEIFRFGGDEFVIAYKEFIPADSFKRTLENINNDVREVKTDEFTELRLSCSIGGYYGTGVASELIVRADKLLYQAKKTRDMVVTNIYSD